MIDRRAGSESTGKGLASASAETRPLVYACSGCSSAAQMANDLALRLDREGLAEMSCIAGVAAT